MKEWMNSRERGEATLERKERDRVPFWPKLGKTYPVFQTGRFKNMDIDLLHSYIGSDPIYFFGLNMNCINDKVEIIKKAAGNERCTIYKTPDGDLIEREMFADGVFEWHPVEFAIKTIEDVKRARYLYENTKYIVDEKTLEDHKISLAKKSKDQFCIGVSGKNSPLMHLSQHKMGLENTLYQLYDYPDEMEELMALMHGDYLRRLEVLVKNTPVKYIMSTENTSTTLINPSQFEKYCMVHLTDYGNLMEQYGKSQVLHMCGKLKALLPMIDKIPASSIEAFSSPTVGDTTLKDGFTQCPSKVLIGGSCASTWMLSENEIIETIMSEIRDAETTEGLYLTTGGVIPVSADPEKIKSVWEKLKEFLDQYSKRNGF